MDMMLEEEVSVEGQERPMDVNFDVSPYEVPYISSLNQKTHRDILKKAADWLIKEGITSKDELAHILEKPLSKSEYDMIEDKEDYWLIVLANGLGDYEKQRQLRIKSGRQGPNFLEKFRNQMVWEGRGIELYRQTYGEFPDFYERDKIAHQNGIRFGAYFVLREVALNKPVNYAPEVQNRMMKICSEARNHSPRDKRVDV